MSEQVLRSGNVMERSRTRTITQIAMLGALAGVLMNIEFPIPFLAPSFYQLDFSEIPVLVGTFAMGPVAGILIEVVKVLVHLVTMGTVTAGVGDFANFIFGCAFVVPAGLTMISTTNPRRLCTEELTAAPISINASIGIPNALPYAGRSTKAFIRQAAAVVRSVPAAIPSTACLRLFV